MLRPGGGSHHDRLLRSVRHRLSEKLRRQRQPGKCCGTSRLGTLSKRMSDPGTLTSFVSRIGFLGPADKRTQPSCTSSLLVNASMADAPFMNEASSHPSEFGILFLPKSGAEMRKLRPFTFLYCDALRGEALPRNACQRRVEPGRGFRLWKSCPSHSVLGYTGALSDFLMYAYAPF